MDEKTRVWINMVWANAHHLSCCNCCGYPRPLYKYLGHHFECIYYENVKYKKDGYDPKEGF